MSHKTTFILILLSALSVVSGAANLVVNGDFENPTGAGWKQWWGGNSNRYVSDPLLPSNHCAGVWYSDDGVIQSITVGPGIYEFGGKLLHGALAEAPLFNRRGVIQAEIGDETNIWWTQQLDITPTSPKEWQSARSQDGYPNSMIIDNTAAGATRIALNLFLVDTGDNPAGVVRYDNIYLGLQGISKQAKFPHPTIGELVAPATDVIRWIKPDPNNPADTITCDVFFDTNNPPLTQIADNITADSITLSALPPPITLLPGIQYFWRVDCTDPNSGGNPVTTLGDVWTFSTRDDNPPIVDAGANQYLWIDMNDGDNDPTKVTFTLDGTLIDDGQSPVTTQWSLIYSEQDPATVVNIISPAAVDTMVTINGTGFYRFQLQAEDAYALVSDTVEVIVYGSACEAAKGDPADHYHTYAFIGDVNNDCQIDLEDLAIVAATWLDCVSDKLGCTP